MGRTNPDLRIKFRSLAFSNPESSNTFCQAMSESSIHGINLFDCCFESPTALSRALTKSMVREVMISFLSLTERSMAEFLTSLTRDISTMGQLEALYCGQFHSKDEFGSNDEAVGHLMHAVAQCRILRRLELYCHKYPQHADAALAECFKSANSKLAELQARCLSLDSDSEPRITESPLLLEALKNNYTVRRIQLHAEEKRFREGVIDPWDPLLKKNIEMFAKLNCAGRSYITTQDSTRMDRKTVLRFLGAISDDLDCLFYHLSEENPTLCDRHTVTGGATTSGGR